jgi:hypothetical protein
LAARSFSGIAAYSSAEKALPKSRVMQLVGSSACIASAQGLTTYLC